MIQSKEIKPLPCPFCGKDITVRKFMGTYDIYCFVCNYQFTNNVNKDKAVKKWNTRGGTAK